MIAFLQGCMSDTINIKDPCLFNVSNQYQIQVWDNY